MSRPFLVADERDRTAVETTKADNQRSVVGTATVAVQLDPVLEQAFDIVEGVRTVLVPRELDRMPDLLVRRRRLDAVELALQLVEVSGEAGAAEQVEGAQARQALA